MEFRIYTHTSGDYYLITMFHCVYKCPKWIPSAWIQSADHCSALTRLVLIPHMRPRGGCCKECFLRVLALKFSQKKKVDVRCHVSRRVHPSCSLLKVIGKRKVQSTVFLLTAANLTHVDKYVIRFEVRNPILKLRHSHRTYRGADKSLDRHISRCILFDGENISFDASLLYINSTNMPPIMIINMIYEHQNLLSL
jgi:hypothetical protein